MTRRLSLFDSPFLLGFDQLERTLDRAMRGASEGYPPYNIEQIGDSHLRITVAVAGFDPADLSVQVEQNQLVIRGKREAAEDDGRVYLHRGIATRQFQRSFILSDDIEVESAEIGNGLLGISLRRLVSESTIRTIPISRGDKTAAQSRTIDVQGDKNA